MSLNILESLSCFVPWLAGEDEDNSEASCLVLDAECTMTEANERSRKMLDGLETASDVSESEWNSFEKSVKRGDPISSINTHGQFHRNFSHAGAHSSVSLAASVVRPLLRKTTD
eukprot:gene504-963_t